MHQLTGVLVEKSKADDRLSAQIAAERIMDWRLSGEGNMPFDWYANHNDGRWADDENIKSPVLDLGTKEGIKVLKQLHENTINEKKRALEKCKKLLDEQSIDDIFKNEKHMTLFPFFEVGRYRGLGVYLYDFDGEGVSNWWYKELNKEIDKYWLVLFDCHN